ncbi:hypothetical protein [Pseudoxanthomonas sp. SGNA-20]|uniref:hypothetical protein n=1 Tax=Pseudoxanthomonas sp. SGNA-20 TaxID=2493088 RepID=UPI001F1EC3F7|nr:hypothetical protein [Pseudoxanthomonas sp. SGNA-20]
MLRHILSFEGRLLLRNGVFWIVLAVFGLFGFASMASDNVSFGGGGGGGNIMRNAPAVVVSLLCAFSVLSVLLSTIFVAGIACATSSSAPRSCSSPPLCASATTCSAASAVVSSPAWRSCWSSPSGFGWAA